MAKRAVVLVEEAVEALTPVVAAEAAGVDTVDVTTGVDMVAVTTAATVDVTTAATVDVTTAATVDVTTAATAVVQLAIEGGGEAEETTSTSTFRLIFLNFIHVQVLFEIVSMYCFKLCCSKLHHVAVCWPGCSHQSSIVSSACDISLYARGTRVFKVRVTFSN
mmetsp:Transcript_9230/g.17432  ORF Transcript_9230/g.17432 Transcript_9230/m.17432 type:complete len:163 (+) Transcript_9230:2183-2671(+)